jgi:hypothetical protein
LKEKLSTVYKTAAINHFLKDYFGELLQKLNIKVKKHYGLLSNKVLKRELSILDKFFSKSLNKFATFYFAEMCSNSWHTILLLSSLLMSSELELEAQVNNKL